MKEVKIVLRSLDDVKSFIKIASCIEGRACVCGGVYKVDAKSIVGILSLDSTKYLSLEIEEWKEEYMSMLDDYLYEKT